MKQRIIMPKAKSPIGVGVASMHEYLEPPKKWAPLHRIMADEGTKTYSTIAPAARLLMTIPLLLISLAIFYFILLAGTILASSASVQYGAVLTAIPLFLILPWSLILLVDSYYFIDNYRFSLQKDFLFVREGTLTPRYNIVPYENVQDAHTGQGFFDRLFNTRHVSVSTPSTSLTIQYLRPEDAEGFRNELLALVHLHKGMTE
jgi:membrane protein YdbS with pleckstrin-like domain